MITHYNQQRKEFSQKQKQTRGGRRSPYGPREPGSSLECPLWSLPALVNGTDKTGSTRNKPTELQGNWMPRLRCWGHSPGVSHSINDPGSESFHELIHPQWHAQRDRRQGCKKKRSGKCKESQMKLPKHRHNNYSNSESWNYYHRNWEMEGGVWRVPGKKPEPG